MTITKYDGVAILPKRCDICNRLFWLESYNIFYKTVLVGIEPIKHIKCKNCMKGEVMEEVYNIYNHLIFSELKDLVKGYVIVRTDMENDSLIISISDNYNMSTFYYRVYGLDEMMRDGKFNLHEIINDIMLKYKNYILKQYLK